jgi:hypothetical protein
MILTNARILTFDRDNSVFDSGSVEIRKDGSIGVVGEIAAVPDDTTLDAHGKTPRRRPPSAELWQIVISRFKY